MEDQGGMRKSQEESSGCQRGAREFKSLLALGPAVLGMVLRYLSIH